MAKLDYYNRSLKGTSYSRRLTLHSCPRKFELSARYNLVGRTNSVTFAFGHSVGAGIQFALSGYSYNKAMMEAILAYDHDYDDPGSDSEIRAKKSPWSALQASSLFWKQYNAGLYTFLEGWEIAKFKHPKTGEMVDAVELTYVLDITDEYSDEGHIDLVLYHPVKNRYMIVEIKTTGARTVHEASYKYSDQPLGYGIILDAIANDQGATASFDVLYLVWKSLDRELVAMPFTKTVNDRARWFQQLVCDVSDIESYIEADFFPHRGESCFNYFRPCQFFDTTCKMSKESLERLSAQNDAEQVDGQDFAQMEEPMFRFTIEQLLARQDELVVEIEQGKLAAAGVESVDMLLKTTQL